MRRRSSKGEHQSVRLNRSRFVRVPCVLCVERIDALHAYDSDPYEVYVEHRCRVIIGGLSNRAKRKWNRTRTTSGYYSHVQGVIIVPARSLLTMSRALYDRLGDWIRSRPLICRKSCFRSKRVY
jgi:hypothetical protein